MKFNPENIVGAQNLSEPKMVYTPEFRKMLDYIKGPIEQLSITISEGEKSILIKKYLNDKLDGLYVFNKSGELINFAQPDVDEDLDDFFQTEENVQFFNLDNPKLRKIKKDLGKRIKLTNNNA